MSVSL
jgi:hypothetical protein